MILNKALLIKGLVGTTAIAATSTPLALNWNKIFKKTTSPAETSAKGQETQDATGQATTVDADTLIANSGLNCTFNSGSNEGECTSLTTNKTINIKHDNNTKKEGITSIDTSGSKKIKIQKETSEGTYNQKVKLTIEGGDITLTGGTDSGSQTISKLEEFETYEITEEGAGEEKKYYLTRKEKASSEIRRTLGLPESCSFPESDNTTKNCSISEEELKAINFEGKSGTVTNSSPSSLTLTITKLSTSDTNYPLGYKFSFKTTVSNNITVSTTSPNTPITFRPNSPVDFKIKKEGNNGKDLKLEKDLTLNTLLSEVGLSGCTTTTGSNECNISTDGLNVKQDSNKEEGRTKDTSSSSGKIKVYSDSGTPSYENNFKFVIEDGDISFGNTSGKQITKLEQFETYEIKKETSDNKYYLTKKTKAADGIKTALGLPDNCNLDSDNGCTDVDIDSNNIKKIKFDGLGESQEPSINESSKLTVSKENTTDSDFPFGYKFIFKATNSNTTLTINSKTITLDSTNGTEFKIKKATSGNNITLEEAWSLENLLKEVGLSGCTTENTTECTIGSLKVKQGDNKEDSKTKDTSNGGSTGKIKVSKESTTTDYNKGFKFVIEDGDISFSGSGSITKLEEFETYEIKKETSDNKWYFSRKKDALEEKRRILGLPTSDESCKLPSSNSDTKTCTLDATKLKAIKFEGKNPSSDTTMDSSGSSVTLKISKTDDNTTYPNGGYKFVFETTQSNITIPKSSSGSIYIKKNTNTEFKIKKDGKNLTLEKAWTVDTLAKKAQITGCTSTDNNKECTLGDKINVIFDNSGSEYSLDETNKAKKLKYEEDQENHNQGFKFYAEEEITFSGDNNGSKKIEKKGESNGSSYEIKEKDGKWYLSKVTPAAGS